MAVDVKSPAGFLAKLMGSPSGQALIKKVTAEELAATLARRQELASQMTKLDREREQEAQRLRADVDTARKKRDKAAAELAAAQQELNRTTGVASGASHRHGHQRALLERELVESASPAIDDFAEEMMRAHDQAMRDGIRTGETRDWTGRRTHQSNRESVVAFLAATRATREAALALKLEPLDEKALMARLAALRAALPEIAGIEAAPAAAEA